MGARGLKIWTALLCAALLGQAAADTPEAALAAYRATSGNKAMASAIEGDRFAYGIGANQRGTTATSLDAIGKCAREREAKGMAARCEVTHLNDAPVTTAAEIRSRVGPGPHPLFLWRYDAGDTTVYLAGSIHVMKPALYPLPVQFSRAFERADHLVVEVDTITIDPAVLQSTTAQYAFLPTGQSLDTVLTDKTRDRLATYLADEGIPPTTVSRLKPGVLATQLAVAYLMALGYLPDSGLEQYFVSRVGGRPILELETVQAQLDLLTNAPMAVQDEMLFETLDQMAGIEPLIAEMVVAWFKGDDVAFLDLYRAQAPDSPSYEAFLKRLLDDRNAAMADKIAGYLGTPGTYFVLVGAAHLAGEASVVQQLARRGIKGNRIYSNGDI